MKQHNGSVMKRKTLSGLKPKTMRKTPDHAKTMRELKVTSAHGYLMKNDPPAVRVRMQGHFSGIVNPNNIQFTRSALFDWAQKEKLGKLIHIREIKAAAHRLGAGCKYLADGGFYRSIKGVATKGKPIMNKTDNRFLKPTGDATKHEYMLYFRK